MRSPVNIVIASFLFFVTIAFAATPTQKDPEALISNANKALQAGELPLNYLTSGNSTANNIYSIISNIVDTVDQLTSAIKGSSLSKCASRCTGSDVVKLVTTTVKIVWGPLDNAYDIYINTKELLSSANFVNVMGDLRDAVTGVVGKTFEKELEQVFGDGSAHIMPEEKPTPTPEKEPKPVEPKPAEPKPIDPV